MAKSVTFGENHVYVVENISEYIRLQTLPGILGDIKTELETLIDSLKDSEKLSLPERYLLLVNRLKPMVDKIVTNRDPISLKIYVKGVKGELIFENEHNKTIIMIDFVNILREAFRFHKEVDIEFNSDKSMLEFNVDPFPSVEFDIEKFEIKSAVLS